ncbi:MULTISPECIES: hypothetical protein [unclassified Streptomyces]|uniref:DUF6895 family protein n=1 Tax=unclassified Streptomyces TaxID=2593676 RepID=UPI0023667C7E|nr:MULTISPECIES: hypothetical protein [unclassified Streptomyces]MDF3145384.1 hypothetical protein [Streptomyces sp. T21Q-yed]WDF39823.1 hypothetical protein PBV52_25020 [Streptomyces sp. T12]
MRPGPTSRALAWVGDRLPSFLPPSDPTASRDRLKPLSELALVHFHLAGRLGPTGELDDWREFLVAACTDGLAARAATAAPADGLYLMQPCLWLRAAGHRDDDCERVLRDQARAGLRPGSPGVLHALQAAGLLRTPPDWPGLCRTRVLRREWTDEDLVRDAYRVTHAVFYATDMGRTTLALSPAEQDRFVSLLERLRAYARDAGRWDLLIETLIALRGIGAAAPAAEDAWAVRREELAVHCDGGTPLDEAAVRLLTRSRSRPDEAALFRSCYHATLADLLLQSLSVPAPEGDPAPCPKPSHPKAPSLTRTSSS